MNIDILKIRDQETKVGGTDSLDNYIEMEDPANGNSEN